MSFDALAWAAKCNPGSAARKLVLLALAECAGRENNLAFPSLGAIAEFSSLNRKTIIAALDGLEADGFITSTDERRGRTGQIKVYYLNLETVPKLERFQKRNSSVFSGKESQKRYTEPVREPVSSIATQQKIKHATKPDDVSQQVWDDFRELRKAKKSPITETGIGQIRREAAKADWTLEAALIECSARGWQGFKADWVKETGNGRQANRGGTSYGTSTRDLAERIAREIG